MGKVIPCRMLPPLNTNNRMTISDNFRYLQLMPLTDEDIQILHGEKILTVKNEIVKNDNYEDKQQIETDIDNTIKVGDICVESKCSIDGEERRDRYYRIIGKINKISDIEINSYLVKEIYPSGNNEWKESDENDNRTRFSLTRSDCKFLNIDYIDGIEVYPFSTRFKKYVPNEPLAIEVVDDKDKEVELNPRDLSTYPTNYSDDTIHTIIIQFRNFREDNNGTIVCPNGYPISQKWLLNNLYVESKVPLFYKDGKRVKIGHHFPYQLVSQNKIRGNRITDNGKLNIAIQLTRDNSGVITASFMDLNINDVFKIGLLDDYTLRKQNSNIWSIDINNASQERVDEIWQRINRDFNRIDKLIDRRLNTF